MTHSKLTLLATLAASTLLLAGCTTTSKVNTNVADTNTTSNTNVGVNNTNVANTNSTNTVVVTNNNANVNTNVDQGTDTSDWLTYTNDEYGFSFRYPKGWGDVENEVIDAQTGEIALLFSNRENQTDQYISAPTVMVVADHSATVGDNDGNGQLDYAGIDFSKSNEELSQVLKRDGIVSNQVQKISIGGKDAVEINEIKDDFSGQEVNTTFFVVPNFTSGSLYFQVTINGVMTEELQKFIETINF